MERKYSDTFDIKKLNNSTTLVNRTFSQTNRTVSRVDQLYISCVKSIALKGIDSLFYTNELDSAKEFAVESRKTRQRTTNSPPSSKTTCRRQKASKAK